MSKIKNDKYYTPSDLAEYVVNKTKEVIGEENITEYLEPSGGNGVFLDYLPQGTYSCDIEPEDDRIVKQDYLELDLEYKKGRCIIGNPPFGNRNTLSVQFYKKSIQLGDYIVFILPISQLNNNQQMYEFDLVYSEDLGKQNYTDRQVHCCLNIYKRNKNGLNKKPNYKLKDVIVYEKRRDGMDTTPKNYDMAICGWGGSIGKEIKFEGQYANEKYIVVVNKLYLEKIVSLLKCVDWVKEYNMTATPVLCQWQIYKYLKEQIPELE